jgi:hypothetical protein
LKSVQQTDLKQLHLRFLINRFTSGAFP